MNEAHERAGREVASAPRPAQRGLPLAWRVVVAAALLAVLAALVVHQSF